MILVIYFVGCVTVATLIQLNYDYLTVYYKLSEINSVFENFVSLDCVEAKDSFGVVSTVLWPVIFVAYWIALPLFLIIVTTPYNIISHFIERKEK